MLKWLMNSGGAGSLEVCNSKIILIFNFRISECFGVLYCLFAKNSANYSANVQLKVLTCAASRLARTGGVRMKSRRWTNGHFPDVSHQQYK